MVSSWISSLYREYEYVTAVYLLEPWEKRIVNTVMAGLGLFTLYAAYSYVPHYVSSFASLLTTSQ